MMAHAASGGGAPTAPADATNLFIWLRSDQAIYKDLGSTPATADGDAVEQWNDLSGNSNNAIYEVTHTAPKLRTSAVNGQNAIEFLASDIREFVFTSHILDGLTSGEVFVVLKSDNDPATSYAAGQLYRFGNADPFDTYVTYPNADGLNGDLLEVFGTTVQKNCGNPTPSFSSTYRVYNAYSASADWQNFIDGTSLFSTGTNTVGWPTTPKLGCGINAGFSWSGRIAEFLFYKHKLSGTDRATVTAYLGARYGLF